VSHPHLPFSRDVITEFPKSLPTADYVGEAEASDQQRYYLKGDKDGKAVRASEWICTHLAENVGVAAPAAAILRRSTGETLFGSRRLIGVADEVVTRNYLATPSASNIAPGVVGLSPLLSAIYAFDMFVFNEDRHLGNYLSLDDNGVRRFFAFDFSRALFWRWPWSEFPELGQNTRTCGTVLRALHGYDQSAAEAVVNRLRSVPGSTIMAIMSGMPDDWLADSQKQDFLNWWNGKERTSRLDKLSIGLADGTLL
jgi:hypothetical protein